MECHNLESKVLIVGIRVDTGFDFKHQRNDTWSGTDTPYVTSGEAIKDAHLVKYNNEKINQLEKKPIC